MIEIKEAFSKKEMKEFVKFPFELYKDNKMQVNKKQLIHLLYLITHSEQFVSFKDFSFGVYEEMKPLPTMTRSSLNQTAAISHISCAAQCTKMFVQYRG